MTREETKQIHTLNSDGGLASVGSCTTEQSTKVRRSATVGICSSPVLGIVSSITPPGPGTKVILVVNVLPNRTHSPRINGLMPAPACTSNV